MNFECLEICEPKVRSMKIVARKKIAPNLKPNDSPIQGNKLIFEMLMRSFYTDYMKKGTNPFFLVKILTKVVEELFSYNLIDQKPRLVIDIYMV